MPRLGAGLPEKRTSKAGLQLGCQPHAISSMSPETEQTETVSPNLAVPSSRFLTTRSQDVVQVDLELSILLLQPLGGDPNPLFMSAPHLNWSPGLPLPPGSKYPECSCRYSFVFAFLCSMHGALVFPKAAQPKATVFFPGIFIEHVMLPPPHPYRSPSLSVINTGFLLFIGGAIAHIWRSKDNLWKSCGSWR